MKATKSNMSSGHDSVSETDSGKRVNRRDERGFTLLEMLLVVFILAAIALSTVSFTNNADDQFRYEETQRRLLAIRRAIAGDRDATYQGQRSLSGYVTDNGLLPTALTSLLSLSGTQTPYGVKIPLFDPDPDPADGFNNGGELTLPSSQAQLFKGHRGGYLQLIPSSTTSPAYRDGWGNRGATPPDDLLNFGWLTAISTPTIGSITISSTGANGQVGGSGYDADSADTMTTNDWRQDVSGWSVKVTTPVAITLTTNLRVSLLVYENSPTIPGGSRWKRLTSTAIPIGTPMTPLTPVVVTFPDPALSSIPTQVPIGQHLLVLTSDADTTPHNSNEAPYPNAANAVVKRVSLFSFTTLPDVELVIP
jgi:prepilin-type N-terminal cleavage/methylation domain-containing protein